MPTTTSTEDYLDRRREMFIAGTATLFCSIIFAGIASYVIFSKYWEKVLDVTLCTILIVLALSILGIFYNINNLEEEDKIDNDELKTKIKDLFGGPEETKLQKLSLIFTILSIICFFYIIGIILYILYLMDIKITETRFYKSIANISFSKK